MRHWCVLSYAVLHLLQSPCTALSPRRLLGGLTSPRIINKADAAATTASATHHDNHAREGRWLTPCSIT